MSKYCTEVEDWFSPKCTDFRMMCCGCGLVHEIDFKSVKGKVWIRIRRNERATAAARRKLKTRVQLVTE